ncbi:hypothetical protein M426DRAFT_215000 [Hypoxylon sp. CI-4A]|nr:hypothetical protein M426DRAFT_215000 [Hypoxylon sp. CI-4A]
MPRPAEWKVVLLSADEEGCRFYLDSYKPFRLAALKQDFDAFGSTYEREVAFTDNDWLSRIQNPHAKTFVVVHRLDGRVLSATSLIGPLFNPTPASNPMQASTEMKQPSNAPRGEASPISFQISGVYTRPDVRGRGFAKTLVKAATERAVSYTRQQGRKLSLSVVVYASNVGAIAFYKSCGFVVSPEEPRSSFNPYKNASADELIMHYRGTPE